MAVILIVGDQLREVDALAKAVGLIGHTPISVESEEKILDRVASGQPDLILLDESMVGSDIPAILDRIRATPQGNTIPFIILTEELSSRRLGDLISSGGISILRKPFKLDSLKDAVRVQLGYAGE